MVRRVLSWYISVCAVLVLIVQGLSAFHAIMPVSFLVASLAASAVALVLLKPRLTALPRRARGPRRLSDTFSPLPLALPFLIVLPVIAGISFALGWHVPPNNWDSMTYHLSRAAYWLQWHTLAHFPTNNLRQDVFPGNAEVLMLVTMLLAHVATLAFLVQFTAYVAATLAIYGLGQLMGLRPVYALIGAGAFATMPEVVLQSTSTQNDLTAAAFIVCAVYFGADALCSLATRPTSLAIAGSALGLAIGTKPTAALVIPGLCIGAIALLWCGRHILRLTRKTYVGAAIGLLLGFLLGAPWYIANKVDYGNISGPISIRQIQEVTHPSLTTLSAHLLRYLVSFIESGGPADIAPTVSTALCARTTELRENLVVLAHVPPLAPTIEWPGISYSSAPSCTYHEDLSWFGLIGWLAMATSLLCFIVGLVSRKINLAWMLASGVVSFLLCASLLLRWNIWEGRLFIIAMGLASPLLGLVAERIARRITGRLILYIIALWAVVTGLGAATGNDSKSITAWGADSTIMETLMRPEMRPVLAQVVRSIPSDGRLQVFLNSDDWDFPLFGQHLDRTIEPLVLSSSTVTTAASVTSSTEIHSVLTHQPDAAVALLFHQQQFAKCRLLWTVEGGNGSVPWRLFRCATDMMNRGK